jgi:hypothetical protein
MDRATTNFILFFILQMICILPSFTEESYLNDYTRIVNFSKRKIIVRKIMKQTSKKNSLEGLETIT